MTITNQTTFEKSLVAPTPERREALVLILPGGQLQVNVEPVADGVVATDKHSGIFGEGVTPEAAINDLVTHLHISLKGLQTREAKLSADMRLELQRLRFLFAE